MIDSIDTKLSTGTGTGTVTVAGAGTNIRLSFVKTIVFPRHLYNFLNFLDGMNFCVGILSKDIIRLVHSRT